MNKKNDQVFKQNLAEFLKQESHLDTYVRNVIFFDCFSLVFRYFFHTGRTHVGLQEVGRKRFTTALPIEAHLIKYRSIHFALWLFVQLSKVTDQQHQQQQQTLSV